MMKTVLGKLARKAEQRPVKGNNSVRNARQSLTEEDVNRLESLPKDVGWMLLGGGLMSELMMGLPPFWVLGIIIVYPRVGMPIAGLMRRRTPRLLSATLDFAERYVVDLERRYPGRIKDQAACGTPAALETPDER